MSVMHAYNTDENMNQMQYIYNDKIANAYFSPELLLLLFVIVVTVVVILITVGRSITNVSSSFQDNSVPRVV